MSAIRPIAIAIIRRADAILVGFAYDKAKDERYCRPPGGAIEFGERAKDALRREMQEEARAKIAEPRLLAVLENTFELEGVPKHELIFVFETAFLDPSLYDLPEIPLYEPGWDGALRWAEMADFRSGNLPLYPDGLLDLLEDSAEHGGAAPTKT